MSKCMTQYQNQKNINYTILLVQYVVLCVLHIHILAVAPQGHVSRELPAKLM